jgi:uncharacterized membrane protein YdjX (TVP38/TMEM64 family)
MLTPDPSTPEQAAHPRGRRPHVRLRHGWRRWLPLSLLVLGTILFFACGLDRYVSLARLRAHHQDLTAFVAAHYVTALLIYAGIYILFVALSLPGAVWITIVGGFLFGAAMATGVTVVAATIGACLLFLAAKSSLGAYLHEHAGPWLAKVERGFAENQWSYLLMMRLVPVVPFFIANLLPAFLGVSLTVFAVTTALGIVPGTLVYSIAGAGLGGVLEGDAELTWHSLLNPQLKFALLGLALLAALPVVVKYWRRQRSNR